MGVTSCPISRGKSPLPDTGGPVTQKMRKLIPGILWPSELGATSSGRAILLRLTTGIEVPR